MKTNHKNGLLFLGYTIALGMLFTACNAQSLPDTPYSPVDLPPEWTPTITQHATEENLSGLEDSTFTPTPTPSLSPENQGLQSTTLPSLSPPVELQPPSDHSSWAIKVEGVTGYTRQERLVEMNDHDLVVVREERSTENGTLLRLIMLSPSGVASEVWKLASPEKRAVKLIAALPADEGGVILALELRTDETPSTLLSSLLLRLDAEGSVLWERYIPGRPVQATLDGGFLLLAGQRIVKINHEGWVSWEYQLHIQGPGELYELKHAFEMEEGDLLLAGYEFNWFQPTPTAERAGTEELGISGLWFARISSSGEVVWRRNFVTSARQYGLKFDHQPDGSIIVAGPTNTYRGCERSEWKPSIIIRKIGPDGSLVFTREYLQLLKLYGFSSTTDGGLLLYGEGPQVEESNVICSTPMLVRLDKSGIVQWSRSYRRGGGITQAIEIMDGTVFLSWAFITDMDYDGLLVRLDPEGNMPSCEVLWSNVQHMPADVRAPGIDLGSRLDLYLASPQTLLEPQSLADRARLDIESLEVPTTNWCRTAW